MRHADTLASAVPETGAVAASGRDASRSRSAPQAASRSAPRVRPARRRDLRATGLIHARLLPTGFLPHLGPGFLRTYHRSFLDGPAAVALVADGEAVPVGFLIGTTDNEQHYRWVARHRAVPLALVGLGGLLRDRELMAWFLRTRLIRYVKGMARRLRRRTLTAAARNLPATATDAGRSNGVGAIAVLTHVAVAPAARGAGTGRRLVETFVEHARSTGAREVRLVTPISTGAPAFYRALGWRSQGERATGDGTLIEEFRLTL